jgi:hypothetical protein
LKKRILAFLFLVTIAFVAGLAVAFLEERIFSDSPGVTDATPSPMSYFLYLALVIAVIIVYHYITAGIALGLDVAGEYLKTEGTAFYLQRTIRGYLYAGILLTFSDYYVSTGLSEIWIPVISYFALVFWWMVDLQVAVKNYYGYAENKIHTDGHVIVWFIYTAAFCLLYLRVVPMEPFFSKWVLDTAVWLTSFVIIKLGFTWIGLGLAFSSLVHSFKFVWDRVKGVKREA